MTSWLKSVHPKPAKEQLAWVLTLFPSLVCSAACVPLVTQHLMSPSPDLFFRNDLWSRSVLQFFVTYLVVDLFLLFREYNTPKLFTTTLLHHLPYLLFMCWALHVQIPSVFLMFFPLEISTIFLAIENIFPAQRKTELLVVLFFVFRIVYHARTSYHLYLAEALSPIPHLWFFSALPLTMHAYWLKKLCASLRRRSFVNSCLLSSVLFLTNAAVCFAVNDAFYGKSFLALFCSTLAFHAYPCLGTALLDQCCVAHLILVGGSRANAVATSHPLHIGVAICCFLGTSYLFVYGFFSEQFCYHPQKQQQYYWHSVLHLLASVGHHAIVLAK